MKNSVSLRDARDSQLGAKSSNFNRKVDIRLPGKGNRYKATWKRDFKLPWRKAGLLKSSRWLSGFGPVGCQ